MSKTTNLVFLTHSLSIAAGLFTLSAMVYAGQPWRIDSSLIISWLGRFIGFVFWATSPYMMLYKLISISNKSTASAFSILAGGILITAVGIYGIISMFLHPDAQGGLFFVMLPFLQWGGVIVTAVISTVIFSINSKQ